MLFPHKELLLQLVSELLDLILLIHKIGTFIDRLK